MKRLATIFVTLLAISTVSKATTEGEFVDKHLKIENCKFDKDFIALTLQSGLSRVASVNPSLSEEIGIRTFDRDLRIFCDVAQKTDPILFQPSDNSIHLRVTNDGGGTTNANFFHEFLHFAGLEHIDLPTNIGEWDMFFFDPVYACHMTAFPQIAVSLGIDPHIVELAAEKCATVKF